MLTSALWHLYCYCRWSVPQVFLEYLVCYALGSGPAVGDKVVTKEETLSVLSWSPWSGGGGRSVYQA